jgi:hypothetical protein
MVEECMANLVIACPVCLQKIRAPENVIGRSIKCPQCKNSFIATDPSAPVTASPPAPPAPQEEFGPGADPLGLDEVDSRVDRGNRKASTMMDYLLFRRMVTPVIITALFYVGVLFIIIGGLVVGVMGIIALKVSAAAGLLMMLEAFVGTICGLVMWRIYCEIVVLAFQILAELRGIRDELKRR